MYNAESPGENQVKTMGIGSRLPFGNNAKRHLFYASFFLISLASSFFASWFQYSVALHLRSYLELKFLLTILEIKWTFKNTDGLFLIYCDKTYNSILLGEYEVPGRDSDVLNAILDTTFSGYHFEARVRISSLLLGGVHCMSPAMSCIKTFQWWTTCVRVSCRLTSVNDFVAASFV